jgi:hypothetical protein
MTVPPGYQTWKEVIRQAYESGGGVEAGSGRLLWFLVKGELEAWRSDAYGNIEKIPLQYWKEDEGRSLLKWRPELSRKRWLPIVKLADLQKCLPTEFEQMMETSARDKARRQRASDGASSLDSKPLPALEAGRITHVELPSRPVPEPYLRKCMHAIYEAAVSQGVKPPNVNEIGKEVNKLLELLVHKSVSVSLIKSLSEGPEFKRYRGGIGKKSRQLPLRDLDITKISLP